MFCESNQRIYLGIYEQMPQRRLQANVPRFFLIAHLKHWVVAIAFLGRLLVWQGSGTGVIPLLVPCIRSSTHVLLWQIYSGWASLKTNSNSIQALDMLNRPLPPHLQIVQPLDLREDIHEGVYFRYGPNQPDVLRGLNLRVRRGERMVYR